MTVTTDRRLLTEPREALAFLMEHFKGYRCKEAIKLPMLRPIRPWGPLIPHEGTDYGTLLVTAVKAIDERATITRIEIGGFRHGLQIFDDERLLFVVGDAFVVGGEVPGVGLDQAYCALAIVQTITGLDRDLLVEPITGLRARHVTLRFDGVTWDVDWRV